jgi:hypothetical protein
MTTELITAAMTLAELVPSITRWFSNDKEKAGTTGRIAGKVVEIAKKVTNTSDAVAALKCVEKDPALLIRFQQEIMRLDRDLEQAFLEDRQSARSRDISLITADRYNLRADIMVLAAALGLMGCLYSLAYFREWLPGEAVGIISTIAGIFGSCLKDAYAFEFGSSRDSKTKDAAVLLGVTRG